MNKNPLFSSLLAFLFFFQATLTGAPDPFKKLVALLFEPLPLEFRELADLILQGKEHPRADIKAFSRAYAEILGGGDEAGFGALMRSGLLEGEPEYASFVALTARQKGVYDSEFSHLVTDVVNPILERMTGPEARTDQELVLREILSDILFDIARGRMKIHFGHPRFLGERHITSIQGGPAKEVLLAHVGKNSNAQLRANLLMFLTIEFPRDSEVDEALEREVSKAAANIRTFFRVNIAKLPAGSVHRRKILDGLVSESPEYLDALIKDCERTFSGLAPRSMLVRPLSDFKRLF